jgi:hypothetical protein
MTNLKIKNFIKKFEIEFIDNLRRLGMRKQDVCDSLQMTMPTLNSKIKDPKKLTVKDIENLKKIKFNLTTIL